MTARPELTGLLERAMYDIRQGWPEAAHDAIGRAMRIAVRAEVLEVENLAERVRALEKQAIKATKTPLAELNEFRRSDSRRLDDAIRTVLATHPGWPTAKEVRRELQSAGFYPLPTDGTVCRHLRDIRGKRSHSVMPTSDACAPPHAAIIQTTNRRT